MGKRQKRTAKLSVKLAVITGGLLTGVFIMLILVTTTMTKDSIKEMAFEQFETLSSANGQKIQAMIDNAQTISNNIVSYMKNTTEKTSKNKNDATLFESQIVPGIMFHTAGMVIEDYMISTMEAAVLNSQEIVGAGILFEPYIMNQNLKDYSLFVSSNGSVGQLGAYHDFSQKTYYKQAAEEKQMIFTAPYDYEGTKIVTGAAPVIVNNTVIAVVVIDIAITNFSQIQSVDSEFDTMYTAILEDDGVIVYESTGVENVGKNIFDFGVNESDVTVTKSGLKSGNGFYTMTKDSTNQQVYRFYHPIKAGNQYWYAMTAVNVSDVNKEAAKVSVTLAILSFVALVVLLVFIVLIFRKMLSPIKEVVTVAKQIAQGDLNTNVLIHSNDEIGSLAQTFDDTIISLKKMIDEISFNLNEMGNNNFDICTNMEYKGDFCKIGTAMDKIQYNLNGVLHSIGNASDEVFTNANQVSQNAQELSYGVSKQASAMESLSSLISEISKEVQFNAEHAQNASKITNEAGKELAQSGALVEKMIQAITKITQRASEIEKVIKVIEDIAFQTNILAINASIEAARAGEAGKGFAVVADEVRNLASKSAEAAKSTSELISGSLEAVESGTQIANDTASSLIDIVQSAKGVVEIVDQISSASNRQAKSIMQATQGMDEISSVVQSNSAAAQQSAAASEELSGQAHLLKKMVKQFQLKNSKTV